MIVSALLILAAFLPLLWAQGIAGVRVVANVQNYRGPCPAKIKFTAYIEVTKYPMVLNCQWERSDGAKGQVKTIRVPNASAKRITFTDIWEVSAQHKKVWERLRVKCGSENVASEAATVAINCH